MTNFDELLRELAANNEIHDRISVFPYFGDFDCGVGYSYFGNPPQRCVEIMFGKVVAILTMCELRALIAHELAHVRAGHTNKLAFRILFAVSSARPCPLKTFVLSMLVAVVQTRKWFVGKGEELQADSMACAYLPSASLARLLVKASAFDCAVEGLEHRSESDFLSASSLSDSLATTKGRPRVSLKNMKLITRAFQTNGSFFRSCSQRAKRLDRSSWAHPSIAERLKRLGHDWDTVEDSCTFEMEELIDFEAFKNWKANASPSERHAYG